MERLESIPRATGIEEGLAARIHDPLWQLARQWQFGEFLSEEAASAAFVDVEVETHLVNRWRPAGAGSDEPYDVVRQPLERLVEQEPAAVPDPRLRLEGGLRLARALDAIGQGGLLAAFARDCPYRKPGEPGARGAPPAPVAGGLADALRSRLPDGRNLARLMERLADPNTRPAEAERLGVPAAAVAAIGRLASDWLEWWRDRAPAATPQQSEADHPAAWDPHRLEYAFELGAASLPVTRLPGAGYPGGRLDWWAVDAAKIEQPPAAVGEPLPIQTIRTVPSPARFGGMPAPRFWEMEDARFDPGSVDAAPIDIGRLLLASFATVYGNDWFVQPLRLPVGSLTRVTSFTVTDVYEREHVLTAAGADVDGWSMFALTDAGAAPTPGQERPTSEWFYLAPAMPDVLESPPVESVLLLRDEMANLAWAVESRIADDAGGTIDRYDENAKPLDDTPEVAGSAPRYRVETEVPRNWYPLAPQPLANHESIFLQLVPLARGGDDPDDLELPRGRLLVDADQGAAAVWLHEEEVPRFGAAVYRTHQHARWHDGSVHAWAGRSKRTGGGEGSSGLRFDILE
jgi:hypothetical protein